MAPQVKPELLWKLYYPVDSYGQFCGRPGSATEQLPVAFYADLDADIARVLYAGNACEVLSLDASEVAGPSIRRAYLRLAMRLHPDKYSDFIDETTTVTFGHK